ncbi:hypothetical protein HDU98_008700 [Podochytrium sp. JEL0797]|nr:hypothetical protein HDU98_008700 [Podochytrium sp. JEL0797]
MRSDTRIAYRRTDAPPRISAGDGETGLEEAAVDEDIDFVVALGAAQRQLRALPRMPSGFGLRRAASQGFLVRHAVADSAAVSKAALLINEVPSSSSSAAAAFETPATHSADISFDAARRLFCGCDAEAQKYFDLLRLDAAPSAAFAASKLDPLCAKDLTDASSKRGHVLRLCSRNIAHLSPNIGFFGSVITELELCHNNLSLLPPEIGHLKNLQKLDLSHNSLVSLPTTLSHCPKLHSLHCNSNLLTSLPPTLAALQKLTVLDVARNRLTEIPQEIGLIATLQELDVSGNVELAFLPVELFRLKTLHRLDTMGCGGLMTEQDYDNHLNQVRDQVYSPPTLQELAARCLFRHQAPVLKHLPPTVKAYLSPDHVACCSFCAGPILDLDVIRWRKVVKDGVVLVVRERLCWRHWDSEGERVVAMFGRVGWTAPVVVLGAKSVSSLAGMVVGGAARVEGAGARAGATSAAAAGPMERLSITDRLRKRASSSSLLSKFPSSASSASSSSLASSPTTSTAGLTRKLSMTLLSSSTSTSHVHTPKPTTHVVDAELRALVPLRQDSQDVDRLPPLVNRLMVKQMQSVGDRRSVVVAEEEGEKVGGGGKGGMVRHSRSLSSLFSRRETRQVV